jgi:hypothetical protein
MERRPLEILTTMVIESPPETTSPYLTLVSPRKPNVCPLSKLTTIYLYFHLYFHRIPLTEIPFATHINCMLYLSQFVILFNTTG